MIISQRETHSIQAAEHLRSSILLQAQIETVERNIQVGSRRCYFIVIVGHVV